MATTRIGKGATLGAFALAVVAVAGPGCSEQGGEGPNAGSGAPGTRILTAANVDVLGTTTDDAIVYLDKTAGEVRAIDAEGKPLATLGKGDDTTYVSVQGAVAFVWTNVQSDTEGNPVAGKLTVWRKGSEPAAKTGNVYLGLVGSSADGSRVLYAVSKSASTADIVLDEASGSKPVTLVSNVGATGPCRTSMQLGFAGTDQGRPVLSYCAGADRPFTIQSFAAAGASGVKLGESQAPFFSVDPAGQKVLFQEVAAGASSGPVIAAALDGTRAEISGGAVEDGEWIPTTDGATLVFRAEKNLKRVATSGGTPSNVSSGIDVLAGVSPTGEHALVGTKTVARTDGYRTHDVLIQPVAGGNAAVLYTDTDACLDCLESPFTSDGRYAMYVARLDESGVAGELHVAPVGGGKDIIVGKHVDNAYAITKGNTPTSVVVVDERTGQSAGAYDIYMLDGADSAKTILVAAQTTSGAYFIQNQAKVVYSYVATAREAGIYIAPLY